MMTVNISACPKGDRVLMKQLYEYTYPEERRLSFPMLETLSESNDNITFDVLYDDDTPIGFMYLVRFDDIMHVMYFSVLKEYQNDPRVANEFHNLTLIYDNIIACTEEFIINNSQWQQPFLINNGFHKTGATIIECRTELNVLSTLNGYVPDESIVKRKSSCLTNDLILKMTINKVFEPNLAKFYVRS